MIRSLLLVLSLVTSSLFGSELTLEAINKKYAAKKDFTAQLIYEKRSPYLLRPISHNITLTVKGASFIWWDHQSGQKIEIDAKGQIKGDLFPSKGQKDRNATMLVQQLRELVHADFTALQKRYHLTIKGDSLTGIAKNKKSKLFDQVNFTFDKQIDIRSIQFKMGDELSTITFKSFKNREQSK